MSDNKKTLIKMNELINTLNDANYHYENGKEIISDYEYDKLYDELVELERKTGIIFSQSPTVNVGTIVKNNLTKVNHIQPMLSLDKTKELTKLKSFLGEQEGLLSYKLDGLTIVCTYEGGKLTKAVTRGNGYIGEDITNNAYMFEGIPVEIDYKNHLVIRGEALITYNDFDKINSILPNEEKYKNPRNLCSGSVRQLDPKITAKRHVRFYVFTLVEIDLEFDNKQQQLEWLKDKGFQIVPYMKVTKKNLEDTFNFYSYKVDKEHFPSDGLVLTYNNLNYSKRLGSTSKFPKDSLAFKWKDDLLKTTLLDIEWQTSRTGVINPVAVFEPVEIEGTTVNRASVHNITILKNLKLGIGDEILVYKANMIIPQIAENLTQSNTVNIPSKCPVCGVAAKILGNRDSEILVCTNQDCSAQILQKFVHYCSKNAMNIVGLSSNTIDKFLKKGYLTDFRSLYYLKQYKVEIIRMKDFGIKSYNKLIHSIEQSRNVEISAFIYALGIPNIGLKTSQLICESLDYNLERIIQATQTQLIRIKDIGSTVAKSFVDFFNTNENREMVRLLAKELNFKTIENTIKHNKYITGKKFVLTGATKHFKNRDELQKIILEHGGKVTNTISNNIDYLINNDINSNSSKNKKALKNNIKIISDKIIKDWIRK